MYRTWCIVAMLIPNCRHNMLNDITGQARNGSGLYLAVR